LHPTLATGNEYDPPSSGNLFQVGKAYPLGNKIPYALSGCEHVAELIRPRAAPLPVVWPSNEGQTTMKHVRHPDHVRRCLGPNIIIQVNQPTLTHCAESLKC